MAKQLRVEKVDPKFTLTIRELKSWLNTFPDENTPVILKCQKNFRLSGMKKIRDKPVLIGKRSERDK